MTMPVMNRDASFDDQMETVTNGNKLQIALMW